MKKTDEELRRLVNGVTPELEAEVWSRFSASRAKAKLRGAAAEFIEPVVLLWRMLIDPAYTMKWETKAAIIAAASYFIAPADIVPDAVPGVGFLDDVVVIAWVLHQVGEEVERYRKRKGP